MTRNEFIQELQNCASKVKWTLRGEDKQVRTVSDNYCQCPIEFVASQKFPGLHWEGVYHAGKALGMNNWDIGNIVEAADFEDAEVGIRNQLLKAINFKL